MYRFFCITIFCPAAIYVGQSLVLQLFLLDNLLSCSYFCWTISCHAAIFVGQYFVLQLFFYMTKSSPVAIFVRLYFVFCLFVYDNLLSYSSKGTTVSAWLYQLIWSWITICMTIFPYFDRVTISSVMLPDNLVRHAAWQSLLSSCMTISGMTRKIHPLPPEIKNTV